MKWKPDWDIARQHLLDWWAGRGLAALVLAPRESFREDIPAPDVPADLQTRWTDAKYRCDAAERALAGTYFGGDAFPYFDTQIGPGSLALFLGSEPGFAKGTVWYKPCIDDPETVDRIRFDPENRWYKVHMALIEEGLSRADGRYLVSIPDLVENIDILAAMRDPQRCLLDLIERPGWVEARIREITDAWFQVFDRMYERVRDAEGGNCFSAFSIWGPGKTAKLQCDFSCMISPAMFRQFVQPELKRQCDWLDYSLYHLDGPGAIIHLDALCEIESLNAIQWQPGAGQPDAGDPHWYELLRRIRTGGKGVQITGIKPEKVEPLLDAVGPEGLYLRCGCRDMEQARRIEEIVASYR
jgi:hypothetical protein